MDLETINLSSVWFGVGSNIGWVTSEIWTFFKLQPVFIESMMHAICGPIWKYLKNYPTLRTQIDPGSIWVQKVTTGYTDI